MTSQLSQRDRSIGNRFATLAGWIILCVLAGVAGGFVSGPSEWYRALDKPSWTPPSWLFGPVWTTLYVMMGVAAWLVSQQPTSRRRSLAIALFLAQLALNSVWSFIFFGAQQLGWALVDIGLLWLMLAATIGVFWNVRPFAAILLMPYLAWVTFATALNAAIWARNAG